MRPRLVGLALLALTTACGSTVQLSGTVPAGSGLDAVSAPTAQTGELSGALPSASTPGTTTGATSRVPTATVGGAAASTTSPTGTTSATRPAAGAGTSMTGVTRTTITIGVLATDPQANQTLSDAGFGAAATGDEPASWRAMADEINQHGGIAGRKVVLVFHLINLVDPPAQQGQAACARFTQDSLVALVLAGFYYAPAHTCLAQHGVPSFLGTNYGVDARAAQQSRTVVAWATPLLDRLAGSLPDAFQRMGKLKSGTSAGLFVVDAPAYRRSADRLTADLARRGVKVVTQTVRDSDSGDYAGATRDASSAVLKFRSAGVTEVMFLSHNAFEPTLLMQAASSQGYRPTYLLSTQQYPAALTGLVPASQLSGAVAVGWAPAVDLSSGYDGGAAAQRCLASMKRHGISYRSGPEALVGLLTCDAFELLNRAAGLPSALTSRTAIQQAAVDPATRFVSAVTIRTAFPGGRHDGVDGYRPLAFSDGCSCFAYTGAPAAL